MMESETRYTVSEITRLIKNTLEDSYTSVWIEGEISDFKHHSSGHYYFTLKDENAQISAVMWRGKNMSLFFTPQQGMKVLAQGKITVFEKGGRYQLDVDTIQPLGIGELQIAFEQLKARLMQEGLFSDQYKKPIPEYPETVGIVTSPTGAAIRDIISVTKRRFPSIQLIIYPVRVQGEEAANEIAAAIDDFNIFGKIDVMIIGRGGGSLEDLWPFNEEIVARAIFGSKIPIVSAVGHEVDFTISDFVSDLRAPTPSAAAELVIPDSKKEWEKIFNLVQRLNRSITEKYSVLNERINFLEKSRALQMPIDLIKQSSIELDMYTNRLESVYKNCVKNKTDYIYQLEKRLKSLDPDSVLKRGYSITYLLKDKSIIKNSDQLKSDDDILIRFAEGSAEGKVKNTKK
ncbi:exodeoxyribonuclease VII large subunit [candidate division KSB1 bacterium]